jgi:alpha-galactosidase
MAASQSSTLASAVTAEERSAAQAWFRRHWSEPAPRRPKAGLVVVANHDPVLRNTRGKRPLTIAGRQYRRGLYCHAVSKVIVRLPSAGKTFTAVVGVDSNDQTKGGRGSVIFSVTVAGKEAFRSKVMREGMPAAPVRVELNGAASFELRVSDAGDGISCDQSDWADAKVVLADGKELWVGDLPIVQAAERFGPPVSFTYGGRSAAACLASWPRKHRREKLDDHRTRHTIAWTDPETHLAVRCEAVEYHDFPTVEWTLYFKNAGRRDTPILSDVQPLDAWFHRGQQGEFLLHHHAGSQATPDDYRPFETRLGPEAAVRLAPAGGRGSDRTWPYFNVERPEGGAIVAVGWPGQWSARFARDAGLGLRVRAGQELTHFKLLPGEEVRTPLIVVQLYLGDWIRAQNVWRRWMVAHNLPRLNGKLPPPLMPASSAGQFHEMQNANEANQKQFIDAYLDQGVKIDFWWMDAGWYVNGTHWPNVGTWEVDRKRFPNGLRAVSDHAHRRGVKILVWFEPERVTPGTWLYEKHPEWLLGRGGGQKLLDLGNDKARAWLVEHVDKLLGSEGIDIYRQDFNMAPLGYWRGRDKPDRKGITEIRHVTGYLAFWDELRRRHPGMLIDTCASGGRRNDLETFRRSVPLHKSDMKYDDLTSKQTQLYGLAFWQPYFGAPVFPAGRVGVYGFRSGMALMTGLGYDMRRGDYDFALLRKLIAEWKQVAPNYYGDYYPLTRWSSEQDAWIAWQFDRPEDGEGVVQAFRRPKSPYEAARFRLRGLDASAAYELKNFDAKTVTKASGRELTAGGLSVQIPDRPGAVTILYRRVRPSR